LGGTVGDIESLPYLEAVRQLRMELGRVNCLFIHLTLIPYLRAAKELKTKPTQHSVKELLQAGIQPDILVCRTEHPLPDEVRDKVARFCNVERRAVIEAIDASSIYDVPVLMQKERLDEIVIDKLELTSPHLPDLSAWNEFLNRLKHPRETVKVALVGKYNELQDAYKSIYESFVHASAANNCRVIVDPIHSEKLEDNPRMIQNLSSYDGVLVAPGFGERGIEGKITAIKLVREKGIPFLGICLGMQCAVVEFSRNVLGLKDAASTEANPATSHPVIDMMEDQKSITKKGGTMRLGSYQCDLRSGSKAMSAYKSEQITERHRHRYEFNNRFLDQIQDAGMIASGVNPGSGLVEIIELKDHPWFVGVQFHPELKSTVENPHPLFVAFIAAALDHKKHREGASAEHHSS
jgi:CTP synthase